jgi:hypothetical protein
MPTRAKRSGSAGADKINRHTRISEATNKAAAGRENNSCKASTTFSNLAVISCAFILPTLLGAIFRPATAVSRFNHGLITVLIASWLLALEALGGNMPNLKLHEISYLCIF